MGIVPDSVHFPTQPFKEGSILIIEGCYNWNGVEPYECFSVKLTPGFYNAVRLWQNFVARRLRFLESINQVKKLDGMFSKCPPLGILLVGHRSAFRRLDTLLLRMDKRESWGFPLQEAVLTKCMPYDLAELGIKINESEGDDFEDSQLYEMLVHDAADALRAGLEEAMLKAFKSSDRYRKENALRTIGGLFPSLHSTKKSMELMDGNLVYLKMWTRRIILESKEEREHFPNLKQDLELFQYPKSKWKLGRRWNTSLSLRCGPKKGYYDANGIFARNSARTSTLELNKGFYREDLGTGYF